MELHLLTSSPRVELSGPNVYYNERLVAQLENIGRKVCSSLFGVFVWVFFARSRIAQHSSLRADVIATFLALSLDTEFVRELLVSSLAQDEDPKLQLRCMMLCGQFLVRQPRVIEAVAKIGACDGKGTGGGTVSPLSFSRPCSAGGLGPGVAAQRNRRAGLHLLANI